MISKNVQLCASLIFSLVMLSSESPLDVRINVSENDKLEKVELHFAAIPGLHLNSAHHAGLHQTFNPHRGSNRPIYYPRVPPGYGIHPVNYANLYTKPPFPADLYSRPPTTGYQRPAIPQNGNTQSTPLPFPLRNGGIPAREEERPTSENGLLHLDFGITAPWILPLSLSTLPKTPLPKPDSVSPLAVRCTNTSFPEDVFCDLRSIVPRNFGQDVMSVHYVLLRFSHPHLNGTNCKVVLQPRNENNYEDEDEVEAGEDKVDDRIGKDEAGIDEDEAGMNRNGTKKEENGTKTDENKTKKDENETKKDDNEAGMNKDETKKDENENKKDENGTKMDENESGIIKDETKKDENETRKGENETRKGEDGASKEDENGSKKEEAADDKKEVEVEIKKGDAIETNKNVTSEIIMLDVDEDKNKGADSEKRKDEEYMDEIEGSGDSEDDDEDMDEIEGSGDSEDDKEDKEEKDRRKRESVRRRREGQDQLHLFYDRSSCRPEVSKVVTPLVGMEDVTHIEMRFSTKETHYAKLERSAGKNDANSNGGADGFPLVFTIVEIGPG